MIDLSISIVLFHNKKEELTKTLNSGLFYIQNWIKGIYSNI
jgi:hypothetical protein